MQVGGYEEIIGIVCGSCAGCFKHAQVSNLRGKSAMEAGERLFQQGQFDKADREFKKALKRSRTI